MFYGSPNGVPPKRPLSLLRLLREIRIDLTEERKAISRYVNVSISSAPGFQFLLEGGRIMAMVFWFCFRKQVWATFPRQDEAIKFEKRHDNARVFSYQDHFSGQRRFLVSTYDEFWNRFPFSLTLID